MENKTKEVELHRVNREFFLSPQSFIPFVILVLGVILISKIDTMIALAIAASLQARTWSTLFARHKVVSMCWFTTVVIVPSVSYVIIRIVDLLLSF